MADVSERLSGILLRPEMPDGQTCDLCDQPATTRIQGETDSWGCEWLDHCDHHHARVRAGAAFTQCVYCEEWYEVDPDSMDFEAHGCLGPAV